MGSFTKNGTALYNENSDCCGCGACLVICPKDAITMQTNYEGFRFPVIDRDKCIDCGLCIKTCAHGKAEQNMSTICYAGSSLNLEQKMLSSSAGIFAAVASAFLHNGGAVCGASLEIKDGIADIKHILIHSIEELPKLQGSKYVQSDVYDCYESMKVLFEKGEKILFSGTPCQIAGAKALFKKYEKQMFTIDIICHGVPSGQFFNSYLDYTAQYAKSKVTDFVFRSKKYGWGLDGFIEMQDTIGKKYTQKISANESSYYNFFLNGEIYRDSCYKCPYACQKRVGDLTIGDYWGAQTYSPELMAKNGGPFEDSEGVSCILNNSENGMYLLDLVQELLIIREVDINKIMIINSQLKAPAKHSDRRGRIFVEYCKNGYAGVDKLYRKWRFKEFCISKCRKVIPTAIKKILKKVVIQR